MWPGVKEGWGITLDPVLHVLYVTDGSAQVTRVDARTLEQTSQFTVKNGRGSPQALINELEFVDGYIWANVFYFNGMAKIDPNSGYIVDAIDFGALHDAEMNAVEANDQRFGYDHGNNVCNGIAYDAEEDVFYVTGKRWNLMFKIRLNRS